MKIEITKGTDQQWIADYGDYYEIIDSREEPVGIIRFEESEDAWIVDQSFEAAHWLNQAFLEIIVNKLKELNETN